MSPHDADIAMAGSVLPARRSHERPRNGLRGRRSMWLMAAAFLAAVVLLDRGIFLLLDRAFREVEVGAFGGIINHARKARAEVVVLGSSRALRHYDTALLRDRLGKTVYNAGCDGQGFPYMRGVMDLLLRDYTPELFIIDVDPTFVVDPDPYLDRATLLASFLDESEVIREMIYSRGPLERLKYLSKSFRYNGRALPILRDWGVPNRSDAGYEPVDGRMNQALANMALPPMEGKRLDPRDLELLADMIRAARAAGSRVVLVNSPRYGADFDSCSIRRACFESLQAVADREGVPYVRVCLDCVPELRDPAMFLNPAHLNREGAARFSAMVASRLDDMGLCDATGARSASQADYSRCRRCRQPQARGSNPRDEDPPA
jgi:hypothetical protein